MNKLVLSGMVNFQCKMCGHCCKGWNIFINKAKYQKLQEVVDNKLLNDKVQILPGENKQGEHAKIADQSSSCGFLEEDNLCRIHRNYGLEYLPDVCTIFPRRIFITPRGLEISVVFSCPETMKLLTSKEIIKVITNPPGFCFEASSLTLPTITEKALNANDENRWYFRLEEVFMNLLQDRIFTLEVKMAIIGMLIYYFHSYPYDNIRQKKFPEILNNYRSLAKEARNLETDLGYQIRVLKSFLDFRTSLYVSDDFRQIADKVNNALGLHLNNPVTNESIQLFKVKLNHYYNEREVGHIIQNYLAYNVFSKILLIYGLEGGFYALSFLYAFIRFLALGVAISEGVLVNQDILLKVIAAVDYNIKHSAEFMDHLLLAQGIDKFAREHVSVAKSLALLSVSKN